jgi:hypothetical protein
VPTWPVIFGKILLRAHGHFEQRNGVLESCVTSINFYAIFLLQLHTFVNVKIITGMATERQQK